MLVILAMCESERLNLISSDALQFEIGRIPDQDRKDGALAILKIAQEDLDLTTEIENLAKRPRASGLKPLDALRLAFASDSKVDYFCTCDDQFLEKARIWCSSAITLLIIGLRIKHMKKELCPRITRINTDNGKTFLLLE